MESFLASLNKEKKKENSETVLRLIKRKYKHGYRQYIGNYK